MKIPVGGNGVGDREILDIPRGKRGGLIESNVPITF